MDISTLNRLAITVVVGAALAAVSFPSHAQGANQQTETKQAKKDEKEVKKAQQQERKEEAQRQKRLSQQQQQERIRQQQESLALYRKNIALRQVIAERNAQLLQQQKRLAHYRFQQAYYERLRQQQAQLQRYDRYDFNNDPYYYTAPNYRYRREGRYYETNQYGADILRQALNNGYQEGFQAGRADKQDNWRFDFRQSFAYEDANYGYDGRYVRQEDYNHYFREGFQRGYEDGYYGRRKYGTSTNGSDSLLGAVLNSILNLEELQ
jgi:hypothetical protein